MNSVGPVKRDVIWALYRQYPDMAQPEIARLAGVSCGCVQHVVADVFAEQEAHRKAAAPLDTTRAMVLRYPLGLHHHAMNDTTPRRTRDQHLYVLRTAIAGFADDMLQHVMERLPKTGWDNPDCLDEIADDLWASHVKVQSGQGGEVALALEALFHYRLREKKHDPLDRALRVETGLIDGNRAVYSEGHHDAAAFLAATPEKNLTAPVHRFAIIADEGLETCDPLEADIPLTVAYIKS